MGWYWMGVGLNGGGIECGWNWKRMGCIT